MIKLKKLVKEDAYNWNLIADFKKIVDKFDWTAQMSDDSRVWRRQEEDKKKLSSLYQQMNDHQRKEAFDYYMSKASWDDTKDIEHFNRKMGIR